MPLSAPAPELIAAELATRIATVTTANGYAVEVSAVVRPSRDGSNWKHEHLSVAIEVEDPEKDAELSLAGNPPATAYRQTFLAHCAIRLDSRDRTAADTLAHLAGAEIQRAIAAPAAWWTFGGVAILADIEPTQHGSANSGEANILTVKVSTLYRVSETNPLESR